MNERIYYPDFGFLLCAIGCVLFSVGTVYSGWDRR